MGNNAAVALGLRYLHAILSSPLKAAGRQGRDWKPGFAPNTGAGQAPSSGAGLRFLPGKARREPGPPPPSLGATGFRPLWARPPWKRTSTSTRASPFADGELGTGEHHLQPQRWHLRISVP